MKALLTLVAILLSQMLLAQAKKGDVLIGAQFSYFSSETNTNSDYREYDALPTVAIYFSPHFNMGLGVEFFGFNEQTEVNRPTGGFEIQETVLRLRTYKVIANAHSKLTERLYFNTAFNIGVGRGSVEYDDDFSTEIATLGIALNPGLFYFASKSLVLTANLAELSLSNSVEKIDQSNGISFDRQSISDDRVQIGLGLQYIRFGVMFLID